jgi:predicted HAD superfamily phosphohydrolase
MLIGKLDIMLLTGEITQTEYEVKKKAYEEMLFRLYVKDKISKKELYEKLDQ